MARATTPMTAGELREAVYLELLRARAVAYPSPPFGHHPNFRGGPQAAAHLLTHLLGEVLRPGQTVLSYPDYVLRPVRRGLLEGGVNVVVPAQHGPGYRLLRSGQADPQRASSIAGAEREGEPVAALPYLSACLVAAVALDGAGRWLGKGYGFALPEAARRKPCYLIAHPLMIVGSVMGSVVGDLPEVEGGVSAYATPQGLVRAAPCAPADSGETG